MGELRSGTETTEPATSDALAHSEASPGAGYDGHRAAQAAEDQLPLRQDARTSWDDDPGYDEADLADEYDGDLEALIADDQLPPRQAPGTASRDDDPGYEVGLEAGHYGDLDALTADGHPTASGDEDAPDGGEGDQAVPRDVPPATAESGDLPAEPSGTSAEAAPGQQDGNVTAPGYAACPDSLATGDRTPDTGEDHAPDSGDQGQDAVGEAPPATASPDDPPAEAPGISAVAAPEREDGDAGPGPSPGGASADTSSVAGSDAEEPPHAEAAQAGQADAPGGQEARPGDGPADQEGAPEASREQLKAELRAELKAELKAELMAELKAELQAPKDSRQAAPDAPGDTGREADQPRLNDRELPAAQAGAGESKDEHDRPGLLSNAKTAFYGAVGTVGTAAVLGEYFPGVSPVIAGIAAGAVTIASALVPVLRERRRREHDNQPDKP
jgi:hypothetical protein